MPFFPSMPDDANVRTIFALAEDRYHGWHDMSEKLMREDSPFSLEERELNAGYVSGVNACQFCHGVHSQVAIALGFPEDGFVKLMEGHGIKGDPATFAERGRMKAKIGYADRSPLNADGKPEPAPAK